MRTLKQRCPNCNGMGSVHANYAAQMDRRLSKCSYCDGRGVVGEAVEAPEECPCCGAYWEIQHPDVGLKYKCGTIVNWRLEFKHTHECKDARIAVLEAEIAGLKDYIGTCEECGKPMTIMDTVCRPCQDEWEAQRDATPETGKESE